MEMMAAGSASGKTSEWLVTNAGGGSTLANLANRRVLELQNLGPNAIFVTIDGQAPLAGNAATPQTYTNATAVGSQAVVDRSNQVQLGDTGVTSARVGSRVVPAITVSADRGDASQTLTVNTDALFQRWATTLTANRTVTLSTTGAVNGDTFRVVRTGAGAFSLAVGSIYEMLIPGWVDVAYDGSAWVVTGWGSI